MTLVNLNHFLFYALSFLV